MNFIMRIISFVADASVRRPKRTALVWGLASLLVVGVLLKHLPSLTLNIDALAMFEKNDPLLREMAEFRDEFGSDEALVLLVHSPRLFEPHARSTVAKIALDLQEFSRDAKDVADSLKQGKSPQPLVCPGHPQIRIGYGGGEVENAFSLTTIAHPGDLSTIMDVKMPLPASLTPMKAHESEIEADAARRMRGARDDLFRKAWLISDDATSTVILAYTALVIDNKRYPYHRIDFIRCVKAIVATHASEFLKWEEEAGYLGTSDKQNSLATLHSFARDEDDRHPALRMLWRSWHYLAGIPERTNLEDIGAAGRKLRIFIGGAPTFNAEVEKSYERDTATVNAGMITLVLLALALMFRSVPAVLACLTVPLFAIAATFAMMAGSKDIQMNWMTELLAPLLLVVGLAEAVHVVTIYFRETRHLSPREAVLSAVRLTAKPCFLTNVTTVFGFLALGVTPIPAVNEFGTLASFGILVSFIPTFSLLPALLAWWQPSNSPPTTDRPLRRWFGGLPQMLESFVMNLGKYGYQNPGTCLFVTAGTFVILLVGSTKLHVDTNALSLFPPKADIVVAGKACEQAIGNWMTIEFVVDTHQAEGVKREKFGPWLSALQARIEDDHRVVDRTLSFFDVQQAYKHYFDVWAEQEELKPLKKALLGVSGLSSEIVQGHQPLSRARIIAHVLAQPSGEALRNLREIENRIATFPRPPDLPNITVSATGTYFMYHKLITQIVRTEFISFFISLGLISIVIILTQRSFRLSLASLLANSFPICVLFGIMGWAHIYLDAGTAMVTSIVLGIVVDDTVHFVQHFQDASKRGLEDIDAIREALSSAGTPVMYSTIALTMGFWVLTLSSYLPVMRFGLLSGLAIVSGLVGELLILPAVIILTGRMKWWRPESTKRTV